NPPPGDEAIRGVAENATVRRESVEAAVECTEGLELAHVLVERRDLIRRNVRRVGNNQVERVKIRTLGQCGEEIALKQRDPLGQIQSLEVIPRHAQRLLADVGGEDRRV